MQPFDCEISRGPQVNFNQAVLAGMAVAYFGLVLLVMKLYIKEKR